MVYDVLRLIGYLVMELKFDVVAVLCHVNPGPIIRFVGYSIILAASISFLIPPVRPVLSARCQEPDLTRDAVLPKDDCTLMFILDLYVHTVRSQDEVLPPTHILAIAECTYADLSM